MEELKAIVIASAFIALVLIAGLAFLVILVKIMLANDISKDEYLLDLNHDKEHSNND